MAGGIGGLPSSGPEGALPPPRPRKSQVPLREGPIPFDLAVARGRRIRELPSTERPRERLQLRGAAGLTAAELIGLLWGSGSAGRSAVDLAADAIARFDGLSGLARARTPELEVIPGIGAAM